MGRGMVTGRSRVKKWLGMAVCWFTGRHRWSLAADVCTRCQSTGTEIHYFATEPTPDLDWDVIVNAALFDSLKRIGREGAW
jgi:hypothetical protein